mgnify:CR=1 FL=1
MVVDGTLAEPRRDIRKKYNIYFKLTRRWNQKLHNEKIKMFVDDAERIREKQACQYQNAKERKEKRRENQWWGFGF